MEHYRDVLGRVRANPGGWLVRDDLGSHIAFALGMDAGAGGDLLTGFREFLIVNIGTATTWWWPGLILWLTEPVGPKGRGGGSLPADLNAAAIARWYDLLDQFLTVRTDADGLERIYRDHLSLPH